MEAEFEAERIREEEREAERLAQRQKLQEEQLKERQQKVCGGTMIFNKIFLFNKQYKITQYRRGHLKVPKCGQCCSQISEFYSSFS